MKSIKAIFRRGHKDGQGHQDNISRTSSVTNLDSLEANIQGQQGKGAKPRKVASKERIDKQTQDGKKVTKNNNKLEPPTGQPLSYSSDSLQEAEIQQLRKQLRDMSDEKSSLALQLGEQRGQLNVLQKEIQKLKEDSHLEMDKLSEENTALRNRLRDVAHSPLSDNEKQQLLFESRHHSSAPASIATNVVDDNGGDATTCTTPDWDKHSSGNISEVSVACLQDKINQMQETHYSTNEELQATLQELTDLQRQLTELQQENERLNEEKTLMFDSLCRQTERLNDSRQEVENLKQFLYRDRSDESGVNQLESVVEREQKLVELLRSAQEEREQLLLKLEQIQADLQDSRSDNIEKAEVLAQQSERVRTLECTLDAKHAEHKQLDQELAQAKDQCSGKQIEINRLTDLLENARTKINELEQDRTLSDKSELDELLDNARKEKDQLESEVAYLKEQLARSKNEIEKLKEQVFVLQEECKVTRNNAKTTQSDLEYKCEKLVIEKNTLGEQLQQFQEAVNELQVQAQCHLEDKRQLSAVLSETQRNLSEAERRNLNLETEIQELKKLRAEENDEWEKFQNDLLTSVRVANDFKTEAQQELQKIILENKTYREKLRLLEGQVEKLKGEKTSTSTQTDIILTPQLISLAKNLDQSIPNRLSLLEHPISPTTTHTSSMDKLFPILSRERRSKSRENLSDSEMSIGRSRSKDNLSSIDGSKKSSTKSKKINKSNEKPVLVDERKKESKSFLKRNKSEDNIEGQPIEESNRGSKSFLKRTRSEDNLEKFAEVNNDTPKKEEPGKGFKGFLKRNKSKDNLEPFIEVNNDMPKSEDTNKGIKGFFKRNKSRDNLEHIAVAEENSGTLKSSEDSAKKKAGSVDKPRKSTDSSSSSSKSDTKPDMLSKFIKKRDKKFLAHRKTMSVEEGILLKSLNNWYENIDQNVPDEFLSKEDQAVKKLKILFENDQLKEKPVAHKPKEQLAISKPLLNSVVQNPKLDKIVRDPRVPTVETQVRESALEDTFSIVNEDQHEHQGPEGPRSRIRSEEVYTNIGPTSLGIHKCQSLDDINVFEEYRTESELAPVLYRAVETDNLATEEHLDIKDVPRHDRVFSEIYPNDSVSNPRHSTRYHDIHVTEYVPNELPKPNIYINYENLDEIVSKVPKDVPENKLTEEQRFALKLKLALAEAEKKNTLKKMKKKKKSIRGLEISDPTPESVQKNWKLKEIILNPNIKKAEEAKKDKFFLDLFDETEKKRNSTDISSDIGELDEIDRKPGVVSKSYEDISFSFVPENTLMNLYYGQKAQHFERLKLPSDSSSSSQSYTSAEFNLDTGKITQKWDIPTELNVKQPTVSRKDEAAEDLLYNETINNEKKKKRRAEKQLRDDLEHKNDLKQLKQDLSRDKINPSPLVITVQDKEEQSSWLKGSWERYKKDLKQMVTRIDSDELRESIRRQGRKSSTFETQYQEAEAKPVFEEYKVKFTTPVEVLNKSYYEAKNVRINNEQQNQDVKNFDSQNRISFVDNSITEAANAKQSKDDTVDEAINMSVFYNTIREFILNERMFSEGYNTYDQKINLQGQSVQRDFQISLADRAASEDYRHSLNFKENFQYNPTSEQVNDTLGVTEYSNNSDENINIREQVGILDLTNKRESYRVLHDIDNSRSLTGDYPNHLSSFKPLPKERKKVTVSFYDVRFQRPIESNASFKTSQIELINKDQSTPIVPELDSTEKREDRINSNLSFENPASVELHNISEDMHFPVPYNSIRDFILNEKIFSSSCIVRDQKNNLEGRQTGEGVTEQSSESDKEAEFRNELGAVELANKNVSYQVSDVLENLRRTDDYVTDQSNKDKQFGSTEQVGIVDLVNKGESYNVSPDLDNPRSSMTGYVDSRSSAPNPQERDKVTLSFYNIRFQSPIESNTRFKTSKINIEHQSDIVKQTKDSIGPHDLHFKISTDLTPHDPKDIIVPISHDTIREFILNERIFSEGYNTQIQNNHLEIPESDKLDKTYIFREKASVVDLVNKETTYQVSHSLDNRESLTADYLNLKSSESDPKENNTLPLTAHDNYSSLISDTSNTVEKAKDSVSLDKCQFQSPTKGAFDETADEANNLQILYNTIQDFILNERIFSDGYDVHVSGEGVSDIPFMDPISDTDSSKTHGTQNYKNMYSAHLVDMGVPQSAQVTDEYSFQEILKENQYGVVSPLDLRYTYRGVVKEYKEKYNPDSTEESDAQGSDVSDLEYSEDFIDEFFKAPRDFNHKFDSQIEHVANDVTAVENVAELGEVRAQLAVVIDEGVDIRKREEAVSQIDQEMQAIMEKYLHTRTSLIVKTSGVDIKDTGTSLEPKSNLKKYDNFENLNEIDSNEPKITNKYAKNLEESKPTSAFNKLDIKVIEPDYLENAEGNEPLSLEDLKFIEEMKARYASADTSSTISEKDSEPLNITEEEIKYKYHHLTNEELELIRFAKGDRYSRPLSDINERDLLLIDEISKRYFRDGSLPPSIRSSQQDMKDILETVKEEDNVVNKDVALISNASHEITPQLPQSLPPKPPTEIITYNDLKHKDIMDRDNASNLLISKNIVSREKQDKSNIGISEDTVDEKTFHIDSVDDASSFLKYIIIDFILNERKFSDGGYNIQQKNPQQQNIIEKSIESNGQISSTGVTQNRKSLTTDEVTKVEQSKIAVRINKIADAGKTADKIFTAFDTKKDNEFSHLPPSLRPKKPNAPRPVSYQTHSNVAYRDKNKAVSSQDLSNRPISNPSRSSNRLSDLIFTETIFVPVSKDERGSGSARSPLSPTYKPIVKPGTWQSHETPDFKQTILVPSPQNVELSNNKILKEIASPSLAFKETLFFPRTVKSKEESKSISAIGVEKRNKSSDVNFRETIIIPAKQRPTSYSLEESSILKYPLKSRQPEINVMSISKPEYHNFKETIIVPNLQESPDSKGQNSEVLSLQESVTQTTNSSRSKVKINFNRYSAIPKPVTTTTASLASDRRSFSESFRPKPFQGDISTYEPVYSNVNFSSSAYKTQFSSNINKKPLPVPRSADSTPHRNEYLAGMLPKPETVKPKSDVFVNMTDPIENFSEKLANTDAAGLETSNSTNFPQLPAKFSESAVLDEDQIKVHIAHNHISKETIVPQENVSSDPVILGESKAVTNILKNKNNLLIEPKESAGNLKISDKSNLQNATIKLRDMAELIPKDEESVASGSSSTIKIADSFTVTTKGEQLDITKEKASTDYMLEEDVEDIERKSSGIEVSNVNLFTMDSQSSYDSYLQLFKTKESKDFEDLRGKKSPAKHYFGGFAYVEEIASDDTKSDDVQDETKPKVLHFVPLDDDTTPFFTKEDNDSESYDTLEREKTFHVLGQASKLSSKQSGENINILKKENDDSESVSGQESKTRSDKKDLDTSLEVLAKKSSSFSKASSKSQTDTSRTSFSQAKKLFEALVEANKEDRPKTAFSNKGPIKHNERDSRSLEQMGTRVSVSKEGEVPNVGETGLIIKDEGQGSLDENGQNK